MATFGDRLRSLREETGTTQNELGDILHKGRSTISGYENFGKEPDFATAAFLADYFNVSVDYLIGRTDQKDNATRVLFGDSIGFGKHLVNLKDDAAREIVTQCFRRFYGLLDADIQSDCTDRLLLYLDLFRKLELYRKEIPASVNAAVHPDADPAASASLNAMQNRFQTEVSAILNRLMEADFRIASGKTAKSAGKVG